MNRTYDLPSLQVLHCYGHEIYLHSINSLVVYVSHPFLYKAQAAMNIKVYYCRIVIYSHTINVLVKSHHNVAMLKFKQTNSFSHLYY